MVRPCTCRSPCRIPPPTGKNKLARVAPTNDSGTLTYTSAVSLTPISTPPLAFALAAANSTVRYLDTDLQQIIKTVLDVRPPAPAPKTLFFPDSPCERPLKAKFFELYHGKTYMECYNFIQQCEDYLLPRSKKTKPCALCNHLPPRPSLILVAATQAEDRW